MTALRMGALQASTSSLQGIKHAVSEDHGIFKKATQLPCVEVSLRLYSCLRSLCLIPFAGESVYLVHLSLEGSVVDWREDPRYPRSGTG